MAEVLGIQFTDVSEGYVEATMPVNKNSHQPMGLLHGGASATLAETIGSVGSAMFIDLEKKAPVGIEINCNHVKSKKSGIVTGKAKVVHRGGKIHVWNIDIVDEQDQLIATARLTIMIINIL